MIPLPLQNGDFRFVLISHNTKKPFEKEWQTKNNYKFYDTKLLQHIRSGGNVGLIGGFGGIFIIDDDTGRLAEELKDELKDTYQEKTWSGKTHFIGVTNYNTNHVFKDGLGELRVNEYQALISPSMIEGKKYLPLNDKPIKYFSQEELLRIINPYLKNRAVSNSENMPIVELPKSRSEIEYRECCKLIGKGMTKEEVFSHMNAFKKWSEGHPDYKELTYKKAFEYMQSNSAKKKASTKEEDVEEIKTSLYINMKDQILAEQICEDGISKFCVYDNKTGKIDYVFELNINGVIYKPLDGEEVQKQAVKLPSKAEEYNFDPELNIAIKSHIKKWLDIPEDVLQFAIWNIKRSWVFERFHTLNYLRALGDTGQGKTRFLDTLGLIHYKPIATSGATTAAPIFRMIERWRGTLIMDEADFQKSDESQDIIKIINQGYERDKWIMRCDQNDCNKVQLFDPYCPKVLATRKTFEDKAVESRCITQVMKGTNRTDIPYNINESFRQEAQRIRNMLLMWRFKNFFNINPDIEINDFDYKNLEPRVKQIISSFVSLFAGDKEQLKTFKDYILNYQEDLIEERKSSFDGSIVGAIYSLIVKAGDVKFSEINISAQDIVDEGQIMDFRGKLLNPRGLTSHLKSLGFEKPITMRVETGTKRCIPLKPEHIYHLCKRYGYDVTVVTMLRSIGESQGGVKQQTLLVQNNDDNNDTGHHNNRNNSNIITENNQKIHLPCHICGLTPSIWYDDMAQGKPICEFCHKNKELNNQ